MRRRLVGELVFVVVNRGPARVCFVREMVAITDAESMRAYYRKKYPEAEHHGEDLAAEYRDDVPGLQKMFLPLRGCLDAPLHPAQRHNVHIPSCD